MIKKYAAAAVLSLSAELTVSAVDFDYIGTAPITGTTEWLDAANWTPQGSGTAPQVLIEADNNFYWRLTAGKNMMLSGSLPDFSNLSMVGVATLVLNASSYIRLTRDGTTQNGEFYITGNDGQIFIMGGTLAVGSLRQGWGGGTFKITVDSGLLEVTGGVSLGQGGQGQFLQTGGTVDLVGSTFNMGVDTYGANGYSQSGGLFTTTGAVNLGYNRNNLTNYKNEWLLSNTGTMLVGSMRVGPNDGNVQYASFIQSGTTEFRAEGTFVVGNGATFITDATSGTRPASSSGTYSLSGESTADVKGNVTVGNNGATGEVSVSGGVFTGSANLYLGSGFRTFNGVIGSATSFYAARASGTWTQTGGVVQLTNSGADVNAYIGYNGGLGYYELSSGSLTLSAANNSAQLYIGSGVATLTEATLPLYVNTSGTNYEQRANGTQYVAAEGRFVQTGGTVTLTGNNNANITVGTGGGKGSYELSDGLLSGKALTVGYGASNGVMSSGSFNVSGGEVRLTGGVVLGQGNNGVVGGDMQRAVGRFVQSGGTVTVSGEIQIGVQGGDGAWEMTGGYFQGNGRMVIGYHGTGAFDTAGLLPTFSFTQTGGTAVINNNIQLGWYNENNTASSLGILNVGGDASLTVNNVILSDQLKTHGQVNLNGGILYANRVYVNNNDTDSGLLFNGGTLASRQGEGNNLTGFAAGKVVTESVGTIDNGGFGIAIHAGISGSGGMVFSGSSQTMTYGVNTYTGTTVVKGRGTLLLTASSEMASKDFVVEAGSLLDAGNYNGKGGLAVETVSGGGTIWGKLNFSGAQIITPGDSGTIGTLTVRDGLTVSAGSEFNFLLGDTSNVNSMLKLTGGTFDYTGAANGLLVNFTALSALAEGNYTYTLIDAGSAPLTLSNFLLGAYDNSIYENPLLKLVDNQLVLSFSVIPEPSTLALILTGGALLLILRRRRGADGR